MPDPDEKQEISVKEDEPDTSQEIVEIPTDKEKPAEEPQVDLAKLKEDLEKSHRRTEYLNRQLDRTLRELKNQPQVTSSQPSQTMPGLDPNQMDEADKMVMQDWKKGSWMAVEPKVEEKVNEILKQREQQINQASQEQLRLAAFNASQAKVISKYPELDPNNPKENSEVFRAYAEEMNKPENQGIMHGNAFSPELIMARMEEANPQLRKEPAPQGPSRVDRIQATSMPQGTGEKSNVIELTRFEKEHCDEKGIPYDQFALMKKANLKEGVEIDG